MLLGTLPDAECQQHGLEQHDDIASTLCVQAEEIPFLTASSGRCGLLSEMRTCLLELHPAAPWYSNLTAAGPKPCPDCGFPSPASATRPVRGSRELCHGGGEAGLRRLMPGPWSGVRHLHGFCLPFLCISAVLKGLSIS